MRSAIDTSYYQFHEYTSSNIDSTATSGASDNQRQYRSINIRQPAAFSVVMGTRKKLSGRWQVIFALIVVVVIAVVTGVVIWSVTKGNKEQASRATQFVLGNADIQIQERINFKLKHNGDITGEIFLAYNFTFGQPKITEEQDLLRFRWNGDRMLTMAFWEMDNVGCYNITWEGGKDPSLELLDCVSLARGAWYGGFEDYFQYWPMNTIEQEMAPYVATDSYAKKYGGVLERYFFSSTGMGVFINADDPLHLSFNAKNDTMMCMASKYEPPYINVKNAQPKLRYTVCQGNDVKKVHDFMSTRHIPKPEAVPDKQLFRYPIWSTWAMYKKEINQTQVLQLAKDILSNGFSHSQLEIDDDWTIAYGDMDFTLDKFPDPRGMIKKLNDNGFRVTVWLHPFFNLDSKSFRVAADNGYLVRSRGTKFPALTSWWRGSYSGTLDVTNPEAVTWYLNQTQNLKDKYNISSFKFDAGEVAWLPYTYSINKSYSNPNTYTKLWSDLAYKSDKDIRHQEVRVGAGSQNIPIFVRMLDRDSVWDNRNGLKTLIPCALTMGLIGYPFILPDMIGGNAYDSSLGLEARNYPDEELFIRWMELNTFLPSLQFSVVPWVYQNETILEIIRYYTELHENYSTTIIQLAEESVETGHPIIRPLWWLDPQDPEALQIDSEYLMGDDLLVAPVIEKGATSRDVYIPAGIWYDELRKQRLEGRRWYRNYKAELDELPFFTRLKT